MILRQCGRAAFSICAISAVLPTALAQQAAQAQPALPATAPTQAVAVSQLPSATPPREQHATQIAWDGHLLQISADGASLRDVLQQVSARTGMRISGSAPGDPMYGSYGPAPLADVVMQLVDGLSTNVLFAGRTATRPPELTLTARNGGATPPSNNGQQAVPNTFQPQNVYYPPQQTQVPQSQAPANSPNFGGAPAGGSGSPAASDAPAATDANGVPTSPNGVKTPQEIFEQLQRLRATRPPPQ